MLHPDVSTFWEHHIYIEIQFSSPLPMYLTATYIGVTHIRRIPMYPTMTRAGKDFDGGALGRGLLLILDSRINMTRLVPQLRVLHKSQPA